MADGLGCCSPPPRRRAPLRGRGRVPGVAQPPRRHPSRPQGLPVRRHDARLGGAWSVDRSSATRPI